MNEIARLVASSTRNCPCPSCGEGVHCCNCDPNKIMKHIGASKQDLFNWAGYLFRTKSVKPFEEELKILKDIKYERDVKQKIAELKKELGIDK